MKNSIKTLLTLTLCVLASVGFSQSPEKMSYQAVIRDAGNNLVTNQSVGMQISILQTSATGTAVYIETHSTTTNDNGLVAVEIGTGTVVTGTFSAIDWSAGPYFIKTDTDPAGGTVYSITGTSQLLSVPYALYAKDVENDNDQQTLTYNSGTGDLSISGGNSVTIATSGDDWGAQVTQTDATLSGDGTSGSPLGVVGDLTDDQTLSTNGDTLFISGGNYILLSSSSGNTLDMAYDQGGAGAGRSINVDAGEVDLTTSTSNGIALRVTNSNTGVGIITSSTNAANTFSAIQSTTNSNSTIASAIIGNTDGAAWGVSGQASASSTATSAVYGSNLRTNGGHGVLGIGFNGVVGETNYSQGMAVYGENYDAVAPLGNGIGVAGRGYWGVVGEDRYLGGTAGAFGVYSNGELGASGFKSFHIDHPADPENKILRHFSVESNEVLNMYRGTAVFDANGEAVVTMPDYYDLVNANPTYQLTPIGGQAQLYVKEKISNGRFVIAGGNAGQEVSWVVYAERNDPYAQQNPQMKAVEIDKRDSQKGRYFMPQLYGASQDKAIIPAGNRQGAEQVVIGIR